MRITRKQFLAILPTGIAAARGDQEAPLPENGKVCEDLLAFYPGIAPLVTLLVAKQRIKPISTTEADGNYTEIFRQSCVGPLRNIERALCSLKATMGKAFLFSRPGFFMSDNCALRTTASLSSAATPVYNYSRFWELAEGHIILLGSPMYGDFASNSLDWRTEKMCGIKVLRNPRYRQTLIHETLLDAPPTSLAAWPRASDWLTQAFHHPAISPPLAFAFKLEDVALRPLETRQLTFRTYENNYSGIRRSEFICEYMLEVKHAWKLV